jgi:hypothetical protein
MRLALLCCCLLLCGVAVGQEGRPRFEELAREFDYDSEAPLDVREVSRTKRDGVTVIDLTYASPLTWSCRAAVALSPQSSSATG